MKKALVFAGAYLGVGVVAELAFWQTMRSRFYGGLGHSSFSVTNALLWPLLAANVLTGHSPLSLPETQTDLSAFVTGPFGRLSGASRSQPRVKAAVGPIAGWAAPGREASSWAGRTTAETRTLGPEWSASAALGWPVS